MKIQNGFKKEIFVVLGAVILGVLMLLLDNLGTFNFLRKGISISMEPIALVGNRAGESSTSYLRNFINLGELVKERNELKILLEEKDIQNASYVELLAENEVLQKQINSGDIKGEYLLSSVLKDSSIDHIRVDKGSKDGVSLGNTVSVGNFYVGVVDYVDELGARVKLPSSNSSFLSVVILKIDEKSMNSYVKNRVVSKGVMNGSAEGIMVDNISMNTNVQNGDLIFVNDPSSKDMLVLGYVVGLTNNPANISRSCFVSLLEEYDSLAKVMIRTK